MKPLYNVLSQNIVHDWGESWTESLASVEELVVQDEAFESSWDWTSESRMKM